MRPSVWIVNGAREGPRVAPADFVFEPPPPAVRFTSGEERVVRKAISLSPESCPAR
jgi:hypothetical protein